MAFELDIGFTSAAGTKAVNEDFCAALLPEIGFEDVGAIAAIAEGVSQGGMGKEAAQTTVALDRIIAAQNSWLAGINRRRAPVLGLTTLTEQALKQGSLDNVSALVLRVFGLSDVTLQDENRKAQQLPVPPFPPFGRCPIQTNLLRTVQPGAASARSRRPVNRPDKTDRTPSRCALV